MPENQSRPGQFLDGKKIELLAQHAMVAFFRLLNIVQVLVEIFFRKEGRPVNSLELRIFLVAEPVRAGNVQQLESLDLAGGWNMRPAAEVDEFAGAIDGNLFIGLGELLYEMAFHEIAFFFELRHSQIAGQELARIRNILLYQFLHFLFDLFQILRTEGRGTVEVIKETAVRRRTMAKLGLGKKFQHSSSQQMSGRMPVDFQSLGIAVGEYAEARIFFQRAGQIDEIAVSFRRERRLGQARSDGLGDVQGSRALGNFLNAPVGELHVNAVCHRLGSVLC